MNGTGVISALLPGLGLLILFVALVIRHPRLMRRRCGLEGTPDLKEFRA
jgi:hypothetical protein